MKIEVIKNEWVKLPDHSPKGIYVNAYLKEKLDNILHIQKKEWDAMILIDGKERSGKSILGMTCAWYLTKGKLTIDNFAKGLEEAKAKIRTLPDKSILVVDEASLVFNTKDSRTNVSVELQKIMDVVGQKNMIFILILPSIFDLAKSIATRRSLFLLHVFVDEKWNRGSFAYYGEETKEVLYVEGKKNYNKYTIPPEFTGSFTNFKPPFYDEYLKLKKETLIEILEDKKEQKQKDRSEIWALKYNIYQLMKSVAQEPIKSQGQFCKIINKSIREIRIWGEYGGRSA